MPCAAILRAKEHPRTMSVGAEGVGAGVSEVSWEGWLKRSPEGSLERSSEGSPTASTQRASIRYPTRAWSRTDPGVSANSAGKDPAHSTQGAIILRITQARAVRGPLDERGGIHRRGRRFDRGDFGRPAPRLGGRAGWKDGERQARRGDEGAFRHAVEHVIALPHVQRSVLRLAADARLTDLTDADPPIPAFGAMGIARESHTHKNRSCQSQAHP